MADDKIDTRATKINVRRWEHYITYNIIIIIIISIQSYVNH